MYYFPNETEAELLEKDRRILEEQIRKAKRVETHGYRKKAWSLPNFNIEWRCFEEYLKCPVTKWKMPKSSREKIEIEPLPTEFLLPIKPYKPMIYYDPVEKVKVRRIVGFREIQQKREFVEYLREVEVATGWYDDDDDDDDDDGSGGDDRGAVLEKMEMGESEMKEDRERGSGEELDDDDEEEKETETEDGLMGLGPLKIGQILEVARGGGKKDKGKKGGGKKDGGKGADAKKGDKGKDKAGGGGGGAKDDKGKGKGKGGKKDSKRKRKKKDEGGGFFSKALSGLANFKISNLFPTISWGNLFSKKEISKTAAQLAKEHKENLEEIFKYHSLFRVPAKTERDNEWLELSNTDDDLEEHVLDSFDKAPLRWMNPELSYESQYLVRTLRPLRIALFVVGRSFMSVREDKEQKHLNFNHRKRDSILFFMTSLILWIALVMILTSYTDIQWENQGKTVKYDLSTIKTLEDAQSHVVRARHDVETLELAKYKIPLLVFIINLMLTATWSILIVLGDGIHVAHYLNCWTAALAEMETSGSLGIRRRIYWHHIYFAVYTAILCVSFYFNYPAHLRYSNGMIIALIIRAFKRNIRILPDDELVYYQIAGLIFQIYVVYSSSLIKLLMEVLAIILKNASEMWNFKFALTFDQLAVKSRAQTLRLSLNYSLVKLFTHHRILTVLLRNFGEVFALSVLIYMVCEMGVITLSMVDMFFYEAGEEEDYGGNHSVYILSHDIAPIIIPYYHTPMEDYIVLLFMTVQLFCQYLLTSEVLAKAGASFFAGYEFVRRSGTILCKNSHQRRLIQSLEWSFSSTNPSVLSANSYFSISRETILSAFAAVISFFSLIIQLQVKKQTHEIQFLTQEVCNRFADHTLEHGSCDPAHDKDLSDATHYLPCHFFDKTLCKTQKEQFHAIQKN